MIVCKFEGLAEKMIDGVPDSIDANAGTEQDSSPSGIAFSPGIAGTEDEAADDWEDEGQNDSHNCQHKNDRQQDDEEDAFEDVPAPATPHNRLSTSQKRYLP